MNSYLILIYTSFTKFSPSSFSSFSGINLQILKQLGLTCPRSS